MQILVRSFPPFFSNIFSLLNTLEKPFEPRVNMESLPVRISECLNALYQCRTSNSVSEDSVPYQAPLPEHFEIRTAAVSPATTISTISNMQRDPKQRFSGTSFSTWSSGFLFHGSQNVRRRSRQACSPRRSTGCWSMTDSTRPMWGWCYSWILGSSKRNSNIILTLDV